MMPACRAERWNRAKEICCACQWRFISIGSSPGGYDHLNTLADAPRAPALIRATMTSPLLWMPGVHPAQGFVISVRCYDATVRTPLQSSR